MADDISQNITQFRSPKRILMGPGPSDIDPRVLAAMGQSVVGYFDPVFFEVMEEIRILLRYAYQTRNALTFPISGPAMTGMESCLVNMILPGDKVVVCRNGVFGGRMVEITERCGGIPVIIDDEWGKPVDPDKLEETLKKNPDARFVAFVHAETSTGCLSDAKLLTEIAHRHDALVIVDAVTSLAGLPVMTDDWELDAVYSATQKCLSCTPGISPVTFSDRVVDYVKNRKEKVRSWFMDISLVRKYWDETPKTYHHTPPANSLFGLHEALRILRAEGIENTWSRHRKLYQALKAGLEALNLSFIVKEEYRLPQISAIAVPDSIDEAAVRRTLVTEYNLEIGAGLGSMAGKIWRFGLMGHTAKPENVFLCMSALETILSKMGYPVKKGEAEAAARKSYDTAA